MRSPALGKKRRGREGEGRGKEDWGGGERMGRGDWGGEERGSACNGPIVYALFSGLSVAGKFLLVEKVKVSSDDEQYLADVVNLALVLL